MSNKLPIYPFYKCASGIQIFYFVSLFICKHFLGYFMLSLFWENGIVSFMGKDDGLNVQNNYYQSLRKLLGLTERDG